jgi:hypothetical protein
MKILNNAVTTKCGECTENCSIPSKKCKEKHTLSLTKIDIIDPLSTIDKDCPLQECEMINEDRISYAYVDDTEKCDDTSCLYISNQDYKYDLDDIDYIIIVKKNKKEQS